MISECKVQHLLSINNNKNFSSVFLTYKFDMVPHVQLKEEQDVRQSRLGKSRRVHISQQI
jgi:hypothetical protein